MDTALHRRRPFKGLVAAPRQRRCRAIADSGWTRTNIHEGTVMRMRRLAALLFAGGLAAGLGVGMTADRARLRPRRRPGEAWNEIFLPFGNGKGDTMCVDVAGGSTAAGARRQLAHCHGYASSGAPQRWHFIGGRFYEMSNTNSGLCVGFPDGGAPSTGARPVQERCDQGPAWQLVRQSRDGTDPLFGWRPAARRPRAVHGGGQPQRQRPYAARGLALRGFQDAEQILELG